MFTMKLKSSNKVTNKNFIADIIFVIFLALPIIFLFLYLQNIILICFGLLILVIASCAIKYLINNYYNLSNIYDNNECNEIEIKNVIDFYTFNNNFSTHEFSEFDKINIIIETASFGCRTSAGGIYHNGIKQIKIEFYLKNCEYYFIKIMELNLDNYMILLDKIIKKLKNDINITYNFEGLGFDNKIAKFIDENLAN
ncbi:MAG: hypothetical protein MJ237_08770 [bacterium]|nr:hypothetical protein [bacterium]